MAERDTALIGLQGIEKAMGHAKTKIQDQEETIKRQRDDIKEIEANKAKQAEEIEKLNSSITDVQKELSTAKVRRLSGTPLPTLTTCEYSMNAKGYKERTMQ